MDGVITSVVRAPSIHHLSMYQSVGMPVGDALAHGLHRHACYVRRGDGAVLLCVVAVISTHQMLCPRARQAQAVPQEQRAE